ncbi:cytoplasmic dynein 2 intermediate chain 1-like isoform X2 [Scylla paramamosain]|uniref:cytoplasmic dynein 2 intermediate chain 1-like isoform X2 n=1 Tax=Scylla paramamosain TaxID=85552 RepID=UPI0030832065
MREREKNLRTTGGSEKSRPKPTTSKTSSSKTSESSSSNVRSSSKASSSKTPSKTTSSSRTAKDATSSRTSKTTKSSSSSSSSSSRPAKAASVSSSSSRTHSTPSRPPDKTSSSGSRPQKPAAASTRPNKDARSERSSTKVEKTSRSHESGSKDRAERRTSKDSKAPSTSSRGEKPSQSTGREKTKEGRKETRDEKSSSNQNRGREKAPPSNQKEPSRSRSSRNVDARDKVPKEKSQTRQTSRTEAKSERKSKKDEKQSKDETKVSRSQTPQKSPSGYSQTRIQNSDNEAHDSGSEGMSLGPVVISGQMSNSQEAEVVEYSPTSIETMESGISLSSPQELSGDEVEMEESILSKMVEIDEEEEEDKQRGASMMDVESLSLQGMSGAQPPESHTGLPVSDAGDDDDNYEDDFEDYESDFEEDSGSGVEDEDSSGSSEDEESGSSLEESDVDSADSEVAAVLLAIQEENRFEKRLERTFSVDVPEESRNSISPEKKIQPVPIPEVEDIIDKQKPQTQVARPKTSRTFVNFERAKKQQKMAQVSSTMTCRGRALLSMIQLDIVNVDLFTLSPVSYETYISTFGQANRQQVHVQTNEDALCEEVQTDEIITRDKWTQKPVHISVGTDNQLPGPQDYMGVGGDMDPREYSTMPRKNANTGYLTSFLTSASQVMLAILEEELLWDLAESSSADSSSSMEGLGFSHPPAPLGSSVKPLLQGRPIPFVQFCAAEPTLLLSGHGYQPLEEEDAMELSESGLVCLWSVQEPSRPQQLLCCRASPVAATFSPSKPSLVLAGLEDGSLAAWDLREHFKFHCLKIEIDDVNWRVRIPSFITACDVDDGGEGSRIVAIQSVTTPEDLEADTQGSFQVVTLSNDGKVTWWVVVRVPFTNALMDIGIGKKYSSNSIEESKVGVSPHTGAAPWARIALNRAATIDVATTLYGEHHLTGGVTCHSLRIDPSDSSQLYVASVNGAVAHCSRHNGKTYPKAYLPDIEPGCEATCLAVCPHDNRYLLVGSGDGVVRLHSNEIDHPLTSWQSAQDFSPIVDVQWSPARPCVFYVLDSNGRLHVWDLSAGDIFPVLTIEAGGLVDGSLSSLHIASTQRASHQPLNAVFASNTGELVLRQVSSEFCAYEHVEDYKTELERFTYYVNII